MRTDATIKEFQEEQDKIIDYIIEHLGRLEKNLCEFKGFSITIAHKRYTKENHIKVFRKVQRLESDLDEMKNQSIVEMIYAFEEKFQTEVSYVSVSVGVDNSLKQKAVNIDFNTYSNLRFNQLRDMIGFVEKDTVEYVNMYV